MRQTKSVQESSRPWWVYILYAGTGVLGRAIATRFFLDGRNYRRSGKGVRIARTESLNSGIDPERISATTVIGQRVRGSDGKELGTIEEVSLNLTAATISYLVLSVGGMWGIGDKFYAVPLSALTLKLAEKTLYLDINKKHLKQIPAFDKHNWPREAVWPVI